jgi:hypothetical protein
MDSEHYSFYRNGLQSLLLWWIASVCGIIWVCRWFATLNGNDYYLILFIYDFSMFALVFYWLLIFIFYWKIFYEAKYRILMFTFPCVIMLSLIVPVMCFAAFPMKETPTNIAHASVVVYFFTYICLFIYYFWQQKKGFSGKLGAKISRQIRKRNIYDYTKYTSISSDVDIDGFAQKILDKAAPYLIAIAPFATFIGIKGIGGGYIVYFLQLIVYIMLPYSVRMVAYELGLFFFIRKIEKEYDVTIYNGKAT